MTRAPIRTALWAVVLAAVIGTGVGCERRQPPAVGNAGEDIDKAAVDELTAALGRARVDSPEAVDRHGIRSVVTAAGGIARMEMQPPAVPSDGPHAIAASAPETDRAAGPR